MNLLVTGAWQCTEEQLNILRGAGHEVAFMQFEKDELPCDYAWVEGAICNGLFLSHPIEKFTNLKFIQLTSAGFDRVPMDYVDERGIEIHNARGVYSIPMAEFAISGVLRLYKQSMFFGIDQSKHNWEKHRDLIELAGKTVAIVGCGSVGTECAKRFKAFDCQVVGIDLYPREDENYSEMQGLDNLDSALEVADIVVLTLPLTNETWHLIGEKQFAKLKDTAVLVNIARGAVVDTAALTTWLGANQGAGAVLDVFEEEPLSTDSPLWEMKNVIITPHNSFVGDGNKKRLWEVIKGNLWK